jgi:hypothetical protein
VKSAIGELFSSLGEKSMANALNILEVLVAYKLSRISYGTASLLLTVEGLFPKEISKLLKSTIGEKNEKQVSETK